MDLVINQLYEIGDKLLFPTNTSGRTIYVLVKVEDVSKIEKQTDGTYKINYVASVYDEAISKNPEPVYKKMIVEESKLIDIDHFVNTVAANF